MPPSVQGDALRAMQVDTTVLGLEADRAAEMPYIASMGIYVAKATAMRDLLLKHYPEANDFGGEIIPGAEKLGMHVQAYLFDGYWEDIGTIESFYNANLGLCGSTPQFTFYDRDAPIYTQSRFLPPSKILEAEVSDSIIGDGCLIRRGARIQHSLVGLRSCVGEGALVQDAMVMGADFYETNEEVKRGAGVPLGIGNRSVVRKAIIDKNARIGRDVQLVNKGNVTEANRESEASAGAYVAMRACSSVAALGCDHFPPCPSLSGDHYQGRHHRRSEGLDHPRRLYHLKRKLVRVGRLRPCRAAGGGFSSIGAGRAQPRRCGGSLEGRQIGSARGPRRGARRGPAAPAPPSRWGQEAPHACLWVSLCVAASVCK